MRDEGAVLTQPRGRTSEVGEEPRGTPNPVEAQGNGPSKDEAWPRHRRLRDALRLGHRWIGITSLAVLVSLAVTGLALNHPELFGSPSVRSLSLAADPTDPRHLIRGLVEGLEQSFDGGLSWSEVPMLFAVERAVDIAFSPAHPGRVYLVLEELGMVRSGDGGTTWEPVALGFVPMVQGVRLRRIALGTDGSMTLSTSRGLLRAASDGAAWEPVGDGAPESRDFLTLVHQVHTGYYFANWFRYVHDAAALALVALAVTGLAVWRRRKS